MKKLVLVSCLLVGAAWVLWMPLTAVAQEQAVEETALLAELEEEEGGRTLQDWFEMGGWIMWGILFCSVLTLGLVLERLWALRRNGIIPHGLLSKLNQHMKRREMSQVLTLCGSSETSVARVLRAGLIHYDRGLADMQDAVETAGAHEATLLRRNLPMLAALANIATMMGLLGTVLGMIESFDLIAQTGTGDARVVAGGIFQALVTTAAGLMVGISAIAFHSFLRRKVEVLEADLTEISFGMLEQLSLGRPEPEPEEPGAAQLAPVEI